MIAVYSILWVIVGFGLILLGYAGVRSSYASNPNGGYSALGPAILVVIGVFVLVFGVMASLLKVQADVTAEEVEKRRGSSA